MPAPIRGYYLKTISLNWGNNMGGHFPVQERVRKSVKHALRFTGRSRRKTFYRDSGKRGEEDILHDMLEAASIKKPQ